MKKLKRLFINKNVRRISCLAAAGAGIMAVSPQAHAQTVISDDFSTGSGNYTRGGPQIVGTTPQTDLPGGDYLQAAGSLGASVRQTDFHGGIAPNFGAFGAATDFVALDAYNTGSLAITGSLGYGQGNAGGDPEGVAPDSTGVALLGFTSQTTGSGTYFGNASLYTGFTGLVAGFDGSLQEYVNGAAEGSPIDFVGTYSTTTPTPLAYDINTATGAISNVSFGTSTATYDFATPGTFSNVYTASALLGGTGSTADTSFAQFASFNVSEIADTPEPSTYALLAGGICALGAMQQLRRRKGNA